MMDVDDPPEIRSVAIIGLGLIGGSLARDLSARGVRVLGWDADDASMHRALDERVVDHRLADDFSDIGQADVVVLAVPVRAALERLRELAPLLGRVRLITDVGSTKASILRTAEALGLADRFVGSHPLAGDHRSGWDASRPGLFADARVFLTPAPSASADARRTAAALWRLTRSHPPDPEEIDAAEHDRRLAWTSHLPQLVSSALGNALEGQGIARGDLGPGGRDVTRLAGSSPEMWAEIAIDNAGVLVPALEETEELLRDLRDLIAKGDAAGLRDFLARARAWHGA